MELLKILIVDDEPEVRASIISMLKGFNVDFPFVEKDFDYQILEEATGMAAIANIEKNKPDIVLLDNSLPDIEGIQVLEHIVEHKSDVLVMLMAEKAYASIELAVTATKYGAHDFVSKPFSADELKSCIKSITRQLYLMRTARNMNAEGKSIRFQFLSVLSHELKAPINAIEAYLQMVYNKEFGDDIGNYQKMIYRSIRRIKGMRHLIMDLLDLTRVEGSKKRVLTKVNLSKIAEMSIDTLNPYAIQKEITINLYADKCICLYADEKEIEIVFNNLISNAIKYNKNGGSVDIWIDTNKDLRSIKVKDSGIGMTESDTTKLFQDFVRIKTPKTKNINGSGLGLSITKKIASLYGGDVKVESKPDVGSTFSVTLFNMETETK